VRRTTGPFAVIPLEYEDTGGRPPVAVVRYDGDPDVFTALVWSWMRWGYDEDQQSRLLPPEPRLFRWNPDPTHTYGSILARAGRPGRGVWLGAEVHFAWEGAGPVNTGWFCHRCRARQGERHETWCTMPRIQAMRERDALVAAR
jgi:hypothetical protein